jgi:hypothetical protein
MSNHPLTVQKNGQVIGRTETLPGMPSFLDAGGRLRVSEPFGIIDTKNLSSRNRNQWHEVMSGVILEHGAVTSGPFQVGEEIRGTLPASIFPIGTIIEVNSGNIVIECDHNDFQVGDTITGQTSGATADLTSTNTGSDIQHDYNEASVVVKVGTRATDYAVRQTVLPAAYVSGKGQNPSLTFKLPTQKAGVVCELGVLTDQDGMGLEVTETDIVLIFRATDRGVDLRITRDQWADPLDGSGPSGETLDLTKSTFFRMPYLWQGVGPAQFYFLINNEEINFYTHVTANKATSTYIRNPSLPIRYKIYNTSVTASPTQLEEYCNTISSEGGYQLPGLEFTSPIGWADTRTVGTTRTPVLAIRLKNEFPSGKKNQRIARFLDIGGFFRTNDTLFELAHIHDAVDITATWDDVGGGSAMEYSTDITAITGRPEHRVDSDAREAGGGTAKGSSAILTSEFINLHSLIAQSFNSDNSQLFVIYATARTGTADVLSHITWIEFE